MYFETYLSKERFFCGLPGGFGRHIRAGTERENMTEIRYTKGTFKDLVRSGVNVVRPSIEMLLKLRGMRRNGNIGTGIVLVSWVGIGNLSLCSVTNCKINNYDYSSIYKQIS